MSRCGVTREVALVTAMTGLLASEISCEQLVKILAVAVMRDERA